MKTTILVTIAQQVPYSPINYIAKCKLMVKSYLKHTNYPIYVATNEPKEFEHFGDRVIVEDFPLSLIDSRLKTWDETLKLKAIANAYKLGYDVTYFIDSDLGTYGWDYDSYNNLVEYDRVDAWLTTCINHNRLYEVSMGNEDMRKVWTHREDRMIYTNREKLGEMIELWEDEEFWVSLFRSDYLYKEICKGTKMMLGEALRLTKSKAKPTPQVEFGAYEYVERRIEEEDRVVTMDRWWYNSYGLHPSSQPTKKK